MTARRLAVLVLAALALGAPSAASADGWHSEQPLTAGSDVPVLLGAVYDIEFWAPNRGLLITADGLWAYDGIGWRRYSTVCGGVNGRIVWAGPLDFWTISAQPNATDSLGAAGLSLCHFVNGAVVASYAQPGGLRNSYLPMSAGACLSTSECWFAGQRLPGTVNLGAFHLRWDGASVTPWPSLTVVDPSLADPARTISDVAVYQDRLFESVSVEGNDVANESSDQPFLLHEISPGAPPSFTSQFADPPIDYQGSDPTSWSGYLLTSDGTALWAAASARDPNLFPVSPRVLRLSADGLKDVPLDPPPNPLTSAPVVLDDIAAEPGTDSVWFAYTLPGDFSGLARLVRLHADGTVDDATTLPSAADGIARKGQAARVTCPDTGQCWMATEVGWLFHLGGPLPRDDAPEMHRLVTYRPPDASTQVFSPDSLPDDNSGIAPPVIDQPPPIGFVPPSDDQPTVKAKKLVTGVKRRMIRGGTTLELRFTLTAKARVQLVAKRKKKVVAKTKRQTLTKGKHKLVLKLNRKRWPTALDLRAEPTIKQDTSSQTPAGADDEGYDNPSSGTVTIASVSR